MKPETPYDIVALRRQPEGIKALVDHRTHSPPSPTIEAFDQVVKGFQTIMHRYVIKDKENHDLRLANEREKQKRQSLAYGLPSKKPLTVGEGREMLVERGQTGVKRLLGRPLRLNNAHHQDVASVTM